MHPTHSAPIELTVEKMEEKRVTIALRHKGDHRPVSLDQLQEMHTQKIHLLIIDDRLQDYSHIHPRATEKPGFYQFEWHPKTNHPYRIWANVMPIATHQEAYIAADLLHHPQASAVIDATPSTQVTMGGLTFRLFFNKPLQAGQTSMGHITILDAHALNAKGLDAKGLNARGADLPQLEPIMGSFAHIVGFTADLSHIVHIHPLGPEPTHAQDRGIPELLFHILPEQPGFLKLFAQVKIEGKEWVVPFGVVVE